MRNRGYVQTITGLRANIIIYNLMTYRSNEVLVNQHLVAYKILTAEHRGPRKIPIHLEINVPGLRGANPPQQHLPLHGGPAGLCRATLHLWDCGTPE